MKRLAPAGARRHFTPSARPLLLALTLLVGAAGACAQARTPTDPLGTRSSAAVPALGLEAVEWSSLSAAERQALQPLQREWSTLEPESQQKWLRLVDRLATMPPEKRARVEARMAEWARMTPAQRGQARLRFQEARQWPLSDRRSRWEEYQALTPTQKNELAERAAAGRGRASTDLPNPATTEGRRSSRAEPAVAADPQTKSNIVPYPATAGALRPVSPAVVQAAPGTTTTLITRRPAPPVHQQSGLPKIAATPEFVNGATLLPRRGAQGAAVEAPMSPPTEPRRGADAVPSRPQSPAPPGAAVPPATSSRSADAAGDPTRPVVPPLADAAPPDAAAASASMPAETRLLPGVQPALAGSEPALRLLAPPAPASAARP